MSQKLIFVLKFQITEHQDIMIISSLLHEFSPYLEIGQLRFCSFK